ncbi:hypothetical protein D1871_19975 [Nakamurella silvestris]|nr:hypothetical protein D1871_19975 [Nakamurella silvestris]
MSSRTMSRKGRIRALLAGGLVLGLGTAITLAAWNDSEFATGTFASGKFNLEGSQTNGTDFADHPTAPGAALVFAVNPANLAPGDIVYAPFAVRLAVGTTNDALVSLTTSATTGVLTGLTYEIVQPTAWGCTLGTAGDELVPAGTAITSTPAATSFAVTKGATATDPGVTVNLCFKVTAGVGLTQSQTGSVTWEFNAVSQS